MISCIKKSQSLRIALLILILFITAGIPSTTSFASTKLAPKTQLQNTITYCDKLKKSEYTATTWKAFQKELKAAKAIYKAKKSSDKTIISNRDKLEKAYSKLMFVTSKNKGNPLPIRKLSVNNIVDEMGTGWNLGNTMDGHSSFTPNETVWQHVVTTKAFIKKMHDLGINTVRVPVTWGNFIDDANNYKINEEWISRVQDIVDYAISQDMYVIINIHHDGAEQTGWLRVSADNVNPVYNKFEHVWRNIAERFKDYDEHLIFESMNEVTGGGANSVERDMKIIMNLNQIFVNVVRSTGSNNSERWLSVPGRYTNIETTTYEGNGFDLPSDTVKNRIFVSVHDYDYAFGLVSNMNTTTFTYKNADNLASRLKKLSTRFTSKGIPVILGEYGASNKKNDSERAFYYEVIAKTCARYGIVACAWDGGDYNLSADPADFSMTWVDRATLAEVSPALINAVLRGTYLPSTTDDTSIIIKDPKINKITDFALSSSSLSMTIGDSEEITTKITPEDTNEVILWETADPTVATVSNGHVRARGIGTTKLIASSRNGSVKKEVTVTVNAKESTKPCTSITTDSDSYNIDKDKYVYLNTNLNPSGTDDYATYKSSDESIATVSTIGKIVGLKAGSTTNITITTSNGLTKTVKVTVKESAVVSNKTLSLALNVFYADKEHNYFINEVGQPLSITGNGQYTVTFNCASDLSKEAIKAGVTSLTNMGAVYIKDYDVTLGKTNKSPLVSCDIQYNEIKVDGMAMTITQTSPKSGIKSSGIFDTNDPLNSWEGSSVKEVEINNVDHVLNTTNVKSPKTIEVTFTISNLVFK